MTAERHGTMLRRSSQRADRHHDRRCGARNLRIFRPSSGYGAVSRMAEWQFELQPFPASVAEIGGGGRSTDHRH